MTTWELTTPISLEEIRRIKVGDIVFVSGMVITARDKAHIRALEYHKEGKRIPVEFGGQVVYHCGPLVRKKDGEWEVLAAGPTTSARMDPLEAEFIENFRPRVIVGKGGMGETVAAAAAKFGALYCDFTGGAAVLAAQAIKKVRGVEWLDLGMAEALWIFDMNRFGPLIVSIDSEGENLYTKLAHEIEAKKTILLN